MVEDNSLNQLVAEGILSRLGYEVRSVVNGVEALEAVESFRYSAILMDCHMPVMDGFTATEEIRRRQSSGYRIPIIAMTAGALVEDRASVAWRWGWDDYISKPVDLQTSETVLARWIKLYSAIRYRLDQRRRAVDARNHRRWAGHRRKPTRQSSGPRGGRWIIHSGVDPHRVHGPQCRSSVTLREAAQQGDNDRLQSIAHELRGAAATAGATHVAKLCAEIESAARRGGPLTEYRIGRPPRE